MGFLGNIYERVGSAGFAMGLTREGIGFDRLCRILCTKKDISKVMVMILDERPDTVRDK